MAAACCGTRYALPGYVSMNFSAFEYWTDGWREGSLIPNDEGLRQCKCGRFVLLGALVDIDLVDASELSRPVHVPNEMLRACIAQADSEDGSEEVELAARFTYWRALNHPYRQRYREHRDAEEAVIKAAWQATNPDRRTWWDRLRGQPAPRYKRMPSDPLTYPAFEPTDEQLSNMERLSGILKGRLSAPRPRGASILAANLAELYREQGRFGEAVLVMAGIESKRPDVTLELIAKLIREKQPAPIRYRI